MVTAIIQEHSGMGQQRERPIDSVAEAVFRTILSAIRNTLDSKAVAAVVGELGAEHGKTLVNAVLEAVARRLEDERKTLEMVRVLPPVPGDVDEPSGHA